MHPHLFDIPILGLPLYSFGVMVATGWGMGYWLAHRRARVRGLDPNVLADLSLWIFVGGFLGARALYVAQDWDRVTENGRAIWRVIAIWEGGIVSYGGYLVGFLAGWVFLKIRNVSPWPWADVVAPPLILGMAFGRIGCFLNGCCWGRVCGEGSGFCLSFPPESLAFKHMVHAGILSGFESGTPSLIPIQLISAGGLLLLFLALLILERRRQFEGQTFAQATVLYAAFRFWFETMRDDTARSTLGLDRWFGGFGGWTLAQWIGIAVAILGSILYFRLNSLSVKRMEII